MTEHNHRRGTSRKRYPKLVVKETFTQLGGNKGLIIESSPPMHNGYPPSKLYGYINKSNHGPPFVFTKLADKRIGAASVGFDFCNGHRGMAKAIRGAKKYVRSRTRFHENAATKKLVDQE